jgi:hypothetical protein
MSILEGIPDMLMPLLVNLIADLLIDRSESLLYKAMRRLYRMIKAIPAVIARLAGVLEKVLVRRVVSFKLLKQFSIIAIFERIRLGMFFGKAGAKAGETAGVLTAKAVSEALARGSARAATEALIAARAAAKAAQTAAVGAAKMVVGLGTDPLMLLTGAGIALDVENVGSYMDVLQTSDYLEIYSQIEPGVINSTIDCDSWPHGPECPRSPAPDGAPPEPDPSPAPPPKAGRYPQFAGPHDLSAYEAVVANVASLALGLVSDPGSRDGPIARIVTQLRDAGASQVAAALETLRISIDWGTDPNIGPVRAARIWVAAAAQTTITSAINTLQSTVGIPPTIIPSLRILNELQISIGNFIQTVENSGREINLTDLVNIVAFPESLLDQFYDAVLDMDCLASGGLIINPGYGYDPHTCVWANKEDCYAAFPWKETQVTENTARLLCRGTCPAPCPQEPPTQEIYFTDIQVVQPGQVKLVFEPIFGFKLVQGDTLAFDPEIGYLGTVHPLAGADRLVVQVNGPGEVIIEAPSATAFPADAVWYWGKAASRSTAANQQAASDAAVAAGSPAFWPSPCPPPVACDLPRPCPAQQDPTEANLTYTEWRSKEWFNRWSATLDANVVPTPGACIRADPTMHYTCDTNHTTQSGSAINIYKRDTGECVNSERYCKIKGITYRPDMPVSEMGGRGSGPLPSCYIGDCQILTEALSSSTFTRYVTSGGFDQDFMIGAEFIGRGINQALNAIINSGPAIHAALDQIDNWPHAYQPVTFQNIAPPPNLSLPPVVAPPIQGVTLSAPPITPVSISYPPSLAVPVLSPPPNINTITVVAPPINSGNPIVDTVIGAYPGWGATVANGLANAGISIANDVAKAGVPVANTLAGTFVPVGSDIQRAGVVAGNALANAGVTLANDVQRAGLTVGNAVVSAGTTIANDVTRAGTTAATSVQNWAVATANEIQRAGVTIANTLGSTFVPIGNDIATGTIYAGTQLAKGVVSLPLLVGSAITTSFNSLSQPEQEAVISGLSGQSWTQPPSSSGGCFPSDALVECEDGVMIRMDELSTGTRIKAVDAAGRIVFSEVFMWLIYEPKIEGGFVRLETVSGAVIRLSVHHYIHTWEGSAQDWRDCVLLSAQEVKPGLSIMVRGAIEEITSASRMSDRGLISPVTLEGSIVVDGVLASCATTYEDLVKTIRFGTWYFRNKRTPPMMVHHWFMKKSYTCMGRVGLAVLDTINWPLYKLAGWRQPTNKFVAAQLKSL